MKKKLFITLSLAFAMSASTFAQPATTVEALAPTRL